MKTKILSVLAIVIITMLSLVSCNIVTSKEYNSTSAEYFKFTAREDGTYAISLKADAEIPAKLYLPTSHNGVDVTAVANEGFKGNKTITAVTIPVGYELIGENAFSYCTNLKTVNIANLGSGTERNLTVGYEAFKSCTSLHTVSIGRCVKEIKGYAFYETNLPRIDLSRVESIGVCSFALCTSLTNVVVPATLVDIHERAFEYSEKVTFAVSDANPEYKAVNGKLVKK